MGCPFMRNESVEEDKEIRPIPGPRGLPILGNILDIDLENGTMSALEIAKAYYPICQLTFAGEKSILICSVELLSELCDESRFHKHVSASLEPLRAGTHDGLFTAYDHERNWELAHRLLVPAFGPLRIREMFPQMQDIAQQLCLKWQRFGSRTPFNLADDFTRATLDTIALCAMGFRFNSFYLEGDFHPFVNSMVRFLKDAETQATLPSFFNKLRFSAKRQGKLDINLMRTVCQDIVNERRKTKAGSNRSDKANDLLESMLSARDNLTGDAMSDGSIIDNVLTFLVAGHETTSGLLSFIMYYLLKNPDVMVKATKEVDRVVGEGEITVEHLSKLKYISAILRETLRLMPTAPGFSVTPYKREIIGGKYEVKPGDSLDVFLAAVHRDRAVYGDDADEFRPERMLDEYFQRLPANAWKPFGNGKRSCIGRAFAWQEALLILALSLQNFTFELVDSEYELKLKESLTIKPDNLWAYATPRPGRQIPLNGNTPFPPSSKPGAFQFHEDSAAPDTTDTSRRATILYGSNSGTCEALAHKLAVGLNSKALFTCRVQAMDAFEGSALPKGEAVMIVTGSYDGRPPDNARQYVEWLQTLENDGLAGVSFAVFGCGHSDWTNTFYRVPTLIDDLMAEHGGTRIAPRGSADTAVDDPFAELEVWLDKSLWPGLKTSFDVTEEDVSQGVASTPKITVRAPCTLRAGYESAVVEDVRVLTSGETSQKIHVELTLPDLMAYEPGDHLAVLPFNSPHSVQRVLSLFRLGPDSIIYIASGITTALPTDIPISAHDLLSGYVELNQLVTPSNLKVLAAKATDETTAHYLTSLATDRYIPDVREKHASILDILEKNPVSAFKFSDYIQMLPSLRPRQYTISSSPRSSPGPGPRRASLTVSMLDQSPPESNTRGVASNYLLNSVRGSIVRVALRHPNPDFRLPDLVDAPGSQPRPIVMVAAGSGIAPFRAFIEELSARQKENQNHGLEDVLPRALLFFGCRAPHLDDLYRDELDVYEAQGVVTVFRAYSRVPSLPDNGCGYVQDVLWNEQELVRGLWGQGAKIFVCGSVRMNEGVKTAIAGILGPAEEEELVGRYVAEVFT